MPKYSKSEREEALARLRKMLKPGDTVFTVLKHVSRSGMSREISIHLVEGSDVHWISWLVSRVLGYTLGKRDGVVVSGCGMDMGFHIVYSLSRALYPNGFGCIGRSEDGSRKVWCPSNDHSNGDRDYTPDYDGTPRNSEEVGKDLKPYNHKHRDGGYALNHRWI